MTCQMVESLSRSRLAAETRRSTICSRLTSGGRITTGSLTIRAFSMSSSTRWRSVAYLPPDANCLLAVMDHCLRSRHCVNVIVAGKHEAPQWLAAETAIQHVAAGIGIWRWASNEEHGDPDVVMACAGDVPTLETLAAFRSCAALSGGEDPGRERRGPYEAREPRVGASARPSDPGFDVDLPTNNRRSSFLRLRVSVARRRLAYRRTITPGPSCTRLQGGGARAITTPFDIAVFDDLDQFIWLRTFHRLPPVARRAAARALKLQMQSRCTGGRTADTSSSAASTCPRSATGPGLPGEDWRESRCHRTRRERFALMVACSQCLFESRYVAHGSWYVQTTDAIRICTDAVAEGQEAVSFFNRASSSSASTGLLMMRRFSSAGSSLIAPRCRRSRESPSVSDHARLAAPRSPPYRFVRQPNDSR